MEITDGLLLAIDPGPEKSGYVLMDGYKIIRHGIAINEELEWDLLDFNDGTPDVVIEMVASYGMPAGKSLFETAVWIGRFMEIFRLWNSEVQRMYRRDVKLHLCGAANAKDQNVIQALVDRFATTPDKYGKGTKKNPGWFYGFKADVWQAYALGVTYLDSKQLPF